MAKLQQISTWLNNYVMKNEIVDPTTWTGLVGENLENFADFGKAFASVSASDLYDIKSDMIGAIRTDCFSRVLDRKEFGMVKDQLSFDCNVQRLMCKGLAHTTDSHAKSLSWNSGSTWIDGRYYGPTLDDKIFTKEDAYKVIYSVSNKEWEDAFATTDGLVKLWNMIEDQVTNTITSQLNALVKRVYCALIDNCNTNSRKIHLITRFNIEYNTTYDPNTPSTIWTWATIKGDRDKYSLFKAFVVSLVNKTEGYIQEYNEVYNDGTVAQFTPKEKVKSVFIRDFISDCNMITNPIDFHPNEFAPMSTISSWQSTGKALVKELSTVSSIKVDPTTGNDYTIENVVGIIYDEDGVGITPIDGGKAIGVEQVQAELFNNYHIHLFNRYFIDTRLASVIFVLD